MSSAPALRLLRSSSNASRRAGATLPWNASRRASATLLFVLATGCAGAADEPEPATTDATTGGETPALPPMRATTPIPVPQPGRPREALTAELQLVWERVELAVAVTPPEPPTGSTEADVQAWAEGPFREWLDRRRAATDLALEAMRGMREAPVEERAMGAALFGYLYEDAVSSIRGAPVPESVAADPELLAVYTESLNSALLPYATMAAQAYYGCITLFREVEDAAWSEWPAYCDDRGAEIVEVFQLVPDEPVVEETTPAEAEPGEAAPPPSGSGGGAMDDGGLI